MKNIDNKPLLEETGGLKLADPQSPFGIRPYRATDAPLLYVAVRESKAELQPWLAWCDADYTIADSRTWVAAQEELWKTDTAYNFVIFERRSDIFVGGVGLSHVRREHHTAQLGFWVRTNMTKHNAATTAAMLLARFGLEKLRLQRIEMLIPLNNLAAQRVVEKIGAKREGYLRKRLWIHGKPHHAILYSLLTEDLL